MLNLNFNYQHEFMVLYIHIYTIFSTERPQKQVAAILSSNEQSQQPHFSF